MPGADVTGGAPSVYRLSTAHVLRVVAPVVIVVGLAWVVVAITGVSGLARGLLAAATVLVLVIAVGALLRPPRLLTLGDDGYHVSLVRGAGVSSARWRQVDSVTVETVRGEPAMVVDLGDAGTTVLPLTLLGTRHLAAQRDVHQRLNDAYGYRPLPP